MKKEKFILIILILSVIISEVMMFLPPEFTYRAGEFIAICSIVSIVITLLISDTKYVNGNIAKAFDMISSSLLVVFFVSTIFRAIYIV